MSPVHTLRFTSGEVASLRVALDPGAGSPASAPGLGPAVLAAQLLWRERMGGLACMPSR